MKREKTSDTYIIVKSITGTDLLCPAGPDGDHQGMDDETNVCFEKDVSERYAGNIKIGKA